MTTPAETRKFDVPRSFDDLLDAACGDRLSAAQIAALESHMRAHPADARRYLEHFQLQTDLHFLLRGRRVLESSLNAVARVAVSDQRSAISRKESVVSSPLSVAEESFSESSQRSTIDDQLTSFSIPQSALRIPQSFLNHPGVFSVASAAAFIIAGLVLLGAIRLPRAGDSQVAAKEARGPVFVAQLTRAGDCVWDDESDSPFVGAHLRQNQVLNLRRGLAEVTFRDGAVALLEGPAAFVLEDRNRGRLDRGKLVARVEKKSAHGFAVETPSATVVDLGTEFGVDVAEDGRTDVVVFQGKVRAVPTRQNGKSQVQLLNTNQSTSISPDGRPAPPPVPHPQMASRFTRTIPGSLPPGERPVVLAKLDFQDRGRDDDIDRVYPETGRGFLAFDAGSRREFDTPHGKIEIEITGHDASEGEKGFLYNRPSLPPGWTVPDPELYQDFFFKNGGMTATLKVAIYGKAIRPSKPYLLTIYSYDPSPDTGEHQVSIDAGEGTTGSARAISYRAGEIPWYHQCHSTGRFVADSDGVLNIVLTDTLSVWGSGIRLNALIVSAFPSSQFD